MGPRNGNMVKVGALEAGPGEGDGGGGVGSGVRRNCQYFCRASWERSERLQMNAKD